MTETHTQEEVDGVVLVLPGKEAVQAEARTVRRIRDNTPPGKQMTNALSLP